MSTRPSAATGNAGASVQPSGPPLLPAYLYNPQASTPASAGRGGGGQRGSRNQALSDRLSPLFASCCTAPSIATRAKWIGYGSGFLFAIGWWLFFDAVIFSTTRGHGEEVPGSPNYVEFVEFVDWLPGLASTLALIMVNLIEKRLLMGNEEDLAMYDGSHVTGKARAIAFMAVTLAMGALGGAAAIMSIKYIIPGKIGDAAYFGWMIMAQNVLIFVSSMTLWFGRAFALDRSDEDDDFSAPLLR